MMPFFNRTKLECVGVVGPEPGLLWIGLKALDRRAGDRTAAWLVGGHRRCSECDTPLQRQVRKKGPVGALPVSAPMPKSVSF